MSNWKVLLSVQILSVGLVTGCAVVSKSEPSIEMDREAVTTETGKMGQNQDEVTEEGSKKAAEKIFTIAINYMPTSLRPSSGNDDFTSMIRPICEPRILER